MSSVVQLVIVSSSDVQLVIVSSSDAQLVIVLRREWSAPYILILAKANMHAYLDKYIVG